MKKSLILVIVALFAGCGDISEEPEINQTVAPSCRVVEISLPHYVDHMNVDCSVPYEAAERGYAERTCARKCEGGQLVVGPPRCEMHTTVNPITGHTRDIGYLYWLCSCPC